LFGRDSRGRLIRARRIDEGAGDVGHEDEYARAAPDAPPPELRPRVVAAVRSAIEEAGDHPIAQDLAELLDKHSGENGADDDGDDGEEVIHGDKMESREAGLKEWATSLREGRAPRKGGIDLKSWAESLKKGH
jgi:hypothetical protein